MALNKKQIYDLKEGKIYKIAHARKGHFVGMFLGWDDEAFRIGDKEDFVFLTFKYDVRVGTDQAHLSTGVKDTTGVPSAVRVSNLRPSLILKITETEEQEWLREVVVPEENTKKPTLKERIFG